MAVALQDQTIKAVLILENEDDETFFNRAKVVADPEEHLLTIISELQQLHPWYCLYLWLFSLEFT